MKINWFSPLPPARTGIADYTAGIVPALGKVADVTLWTDQPEWGAGLESHARISGCHFDRMPWQEINKADVSIYNIGNNHLFHWNIWRISQCHPGIVVLHDAYLYDLFMGIYRMRLNDRDAFLAQMQRFHGDAGRSDGEAIWDGTSNLEPDYISQHYPLIRLALEKAIGVIVHTGIESIQTGNSWPIGCLPLPSTAELPASLSNASPRSWSIGTKETCRLIVFGHIGKNRRIESLLSALYGFRHRHKFHLHIYGELWDRDYFASLVESHGLQQLITLHGFVPDEELDAALGQSHLAINLRYPTMGEASLSQLRIWQHSLPSLVTNVGWYAELPRDIVAHIDPENEIAGIQQQLEAFLADPEVFKRMGENGNRRLREEHSPDDYASELKRFAEEAIRFRRVRPFVNDQPARIGAILNQLLPSSINEGMLARVAGELYKLGGG